MHFLDEPPADTFEFLRRQDTVSEAELLRCFERYAVSTRALIPETVIACAEKCPTISDHGLDRIEEMTTQLDDYWSSIGLRDLADAAHEIKVWAQYALAQRRGNIEVA
jgi:hypothetical protein